MAVIKVDNLTKDYGNRRGVFDVSFEIEAGEVFGFLGPNGAGKTTTIRRLLGFNKSNKGARYINDQRVWEKYYETNADIGYLPGEIAFPEKVTGMELIKYVAALRGMKDIGSAQEIIAMFQLKNANIPVKKMSKGMKQKIGIVLAFMHSPKILILDEPTSGLGPLMQEVFIELVRQEKEKGNTVLMSSHMFAEVEKTCDRVAIIKQGEIVAQVDMADIKKSKTKTFKIKFAASGESKRFMTEKLEFVEVNHEKNRVRVKVEDKDINAFTTAIVAIQAQAVATVMPHYFIKRRSVRWHF